MQVDSVMPVSDAMIPDHVWQSYTLHGPVHRLSGGSVDVYRVSDRIVKPFHRTSLESPHSLQLLPWLADLLAGVSEDGFRISRPVPSHDGWWMVAGGWTVWTFVEGRPLSRKDVPAVINAIRALHRALGFASKHPLLDQNDGPWGFAHKHCWGKRPDGVHPILVQPVDELYARLEPLPPLPCQLIHGDLNHENILVAPGLSPGFIDLTPFWAPVDFALVMFANWIGPRRDDPSVLRYFQNIAHLDQLLIRAAIRMLLVMSPIGKLDDWDTCSEKRATEIVLDFVS
jgi:Ser/Thr protein kinase RdoA (MazF antagonist)